MRCRQTTDSPQTELRVADSEKVKAIAAVSSRSSTSKTDCFELKVFVVLEFDPAWDKIGY
jgi:hypothetical protein